MISELITYSYIFPILVYIFYFKKYGTSIKTISVSIMLLGFYLFAHSVDHVYKSEALYEKATLVLMNADVTAPQEVIDDGEPLIDRVNRLKPNRVNNFILISVGFFVFILGALIGLLPGRGENRSEKHSLSLE